MKIQYKDSFAESKKWCLGTQTWGSVGSRVSKGCSLILLLIVFIVININLDAFLSSDIFLYFSIQSLENGDSHLIQQEINLKSILKLLLYVMVVYKVMQNNKTIGKSHTALLPCSFMIPI